jgi:competence protein ComEA
MIKISKVLLTCLIFIFSSLSVAENTRSNDLSLNMKQVDERIDINHADIETLSLLKGIGVKKAEAIIKYRDENGKFMSVEDLLNVSGIGEQILMLNKAKLTI